MSEWGLMDLEGAIENAKGWLFDADSVASEFDGWEAMEQVRVKIAEARAALDSVMTDEIKAALEKEREEFDRQSDLADGQSY
jgi:hypothetical protein